MPATQQESCRVEYRGKEIVIRGPSNEIRREANRIIKRFACSATPYRLAQSSDGQVVLKPE
ncbi:hypothetical protein KBTX_02273 [wastewater metagenome]|uniref:Uncharacterized protein n=2 Tax=unclassified sequences TaxID=12908 RepID=A0A5B8REM9_9ZZZZ|nr:MULTISPECIES: hypothetical protein [Arhodomonas]MCS4503079.1 hypothetical protein [Arhodomonas aquaeolei]QEA05944.1 hypothetical protein KBTEX_02273 [uncultured organism]